MMTREMALRETPMTFLNSFEDCACVLEKREVRKWRGCSVGCISDSCFAKVIGQGPHCWLVERNWLLASGFGSGTGGLLSSRYWRPGTKAWSWRSTRAKVGLRGVARTVVICGLPFPRGSGISGEEVKVTALPLLLTLSARTAGVGVAWDGPRIATWLSD